jgi:hypothetical protein
MSHTISDKVHRLSATMQQRRDARAIQRAIENAPTPASRQEIELLTRR